MKKIICLHTLMIASLGFTTAVYGGGGSPFSSAHDPSFPKGSSASSPSQAEPPASPLNPASPAAEGGPSAAAESRFSLTEPHVAIMPGDFQSPFAGQGVSLRSSARSLRARLVAFLREGPSPLLETLHNISLALGGVPGGAGAFPTRRLPPLAPPLTSAVARDQVPQNK